MCTYNFLQGSSMQFLQSRLHHDILEIMLLACYEYVCVTTAALWFFFKLFLSAHISESLSLRNETFGVFLPLTSSNLNSWFWGYEREPIMVVSSRSIKLHWMFWRSCWSLNPTCAYQMVVWSYCYLKSCWT